MVTPKVMYIEPGCCDESKLLADLGNGIYIEDILDNMTEEKPLDNKLVLKEELLSPFFPKDYTPLQKQQTILKLLADWHKRQMRQLEPER